jgi:opacity protein-like surface antigen
MKLLRSLLPLVILLSCAAYAVAQKQPPPNCPLKQASEFNGFQLGMNMLEVKDKLADTSMFDSKFSTGSRTGAQAVRISGTELKDEYAEGVDDINLTFVDKRLAVIKLTYHSGAGNWLGATDFFKQLAEKMNLPQPSPTNSTGGRGGEKYRADCVGFNVTLAYSFGVSPSVTIADAAAQKLVNERSEQNPDGEVKDIRITPPRPPRSRPPR